MLHTKILAAVFSAAVLFPLASGASTLSPSNNIVAGGTYGMLGAHFYAEAFDSTDVAGTRNFTFTNSSTTAANVILHTATVNALSEMFTGGVTFKWLTSGLTLSVAQATTNFSGILNNLIGANSSDTLRVSYGDPETRPGYSAGGTAHFSVAFDASPVPLPAGGLLLVAALGGLAALRRRKSV